MSEAFHPDLQRIAKALPRRVVGPRTAPLVRGANVLLRALPAKGVEVVRVSAHATVRVHRPPEGAASTGALVWVHGGGYVIGAAQQDDGVCRRFARKLGVTVVGVDYRLAPKHPFPAALDDCLAAVRWATAQPGVTRVAVGGASAGGGLAAATALAARDEAGLDLAFQLLSYPMIDDRTTLRHDVDRTRLRAWDPVANAYGWASYLGREPGGAGVPELAAPARAEDLAGLPPAWLGVGTLDLFHDEDLAYAARLQAAGVPCELEVVPGAFHGFDVVAPKADVSRAFFAAQVRALEPVFAG